MLLEEALGGARDALLMDVGCGTGVTLEEFGRHGWICGLDLSGLALAYAKKRDAGFAVLQADLRSLPIASSSLSAVLAFDVIEHLDDDVGATREIGRVLRPGGVAILNVPAFASLWSEKDTANHHLRRYTRATLRPVVEQGGLRIERITYSNAILFPAIWCARRFQRIAGRPWNSKAEYHPGPLLNSVLLGVLRFERRLIRLLDLPFGTSVTCVARRI
jgi:SAM-dependent methyltransferase